MTAVIISKSLEMGKSLNKWKSVFDLYKNDRNELTRDGLSLFISDYAHALVNHHELQTLALSPLPFRANFDEFLGMVRGNKVTWLQEQNTCEQISDQVLFANLSAQDRLSLELGFEIEAEIFHARAQLDELDDSLSDSSNIPKGCPFL
jgi:hypothetical protein